MVGKLIKNELKAGLHFITPIYVITAILAAVVCVAISIAAANQNPILAAVLILLVFVIGLGVFAGTIIAVITNFNKSMFRDQGYLTFTLPVSSSQLLFTKALCSFFWIFLSYIINIALFAAAIFSMLIQFKDEFDFESIESTVDTIITMASMFIADLPWTSLAEIIAALTSILIFAVIYVFISTIYIVAQIYFSVSLSNVRPFQKLGIISTIGIYFVVLSSSSVVSFLLNILAPFCVVVGLEGVKFVPEAAIQIFSDATTSVETLAFRVGMGDLGLPFIATILFFFLTSWFMKHKINLK